ncbi:hypothetical protein CLAFUW4_14117 [Fulvia fulva]|uniref:Uncharacterized protein n=1 Tax=Passalora fulva TaxID=5499 RepID=A0A9Q8PLG9_PASFU|nr:uncharacterized protein CLAFUR5_13951 [Fulvia fulva]KAK4610483.1 hypothetical protein CLAFUR4_14120 [Fulvia fulva]KAK4611020.1 hypothetical protein CLAFUR0_14124 [Fulvia fulva]UJO24574.1 hypothetical protein CLAFUR5_13951 [Fulvia fulva]WPV21872.1 hypothetical protein CLAFUW4_14117 [Fulvia fulva]WPV36718.1 hypothetical protein CLAFUW7_14128 [Fulvia fulva]
MFNPGKVLGIPGEDMRTMYAVLNRAITNTTGYLYTDLEHKGPGGLYIGSPTNLEPRPIAALRELYAQIFGHA